MTSPPPPANAIPNGLARIERCIGSDDPDFLALAQTFMGLGMAAEAAQCHSWGLLPPAEEVWRPAMLRWRQRLGAADPLNPAAGPFLSERKEAVMTDELMAIQALIDGGDLRTACARLTRLSHDSQLNPQLCNRAAMLHSAIGDPWEAERWYRTSLVQEGTQVQPWLALAACLLEQRASDEALEAAAIGLGLHPAHPWGLKLRQRALEDLQAHRSLRHLHELGQLPFGLSTVEEPSHGLAAAGAFVGVELEQKLLLQRILAAGPPLIRCIGPGAHRIIPWLAAEGILPARFMVQVFADPDADCCDPPLEEAITVLERNLPRYRLRGLRPDPALTILTPTDTSSCPLIVGDLLYSAGGLLLDSRIDLNLPEHQQLISTPHWRLMVAKAN